MLLVYIAAAIVGGAIGSFLNVVIDRVPAGGSLLGPPSHCPECGRRLGFAEMVPVLSYVALRGRCRTCGSHIPLRVLWVELATALLFALSIWRYGVTGNLALALPFLCVLLVLFVIDLEHKIVPNVIVLPAIALALLSIPVQAYLLEPRFGHYALPALFLRADSVLNLRDVGGLSQLIGGLFAFGVFLTIWLVAPRGMGAGDVKLAALCGILTGIPAAVAAVFGSFILGGFVGGGLLLAGVAGRKTAIPFAPFLVVTTAVAMLFLDELVRAYLVSLFG